MPQEAIDSYAITRLTTAAEVLHDKDSLTHLLQESVEEGNSLGFLSNLSTEGANKYWLDVASEIEKTPTLTYLFILTTPLFPSTSTSTLTPTRTLPTLIGVVQLAASPKPTHSHRAEINKLIISSSYRRLGLARKLMRHVEEFAKGRGKELLTLSTVKDSAAREFYLRVGWEEVGVCGKYAMMPDGRKVDVSFFRKDLAGEDLGNDP